MSYPSYGAVVLTVRPVEANEVDGKNVSKKEGVNYDLFKRKLLVGNTPHTIIT